MISDDLTPKIALIEDDYNLIFFLKKFLQNNDLDVLPFKSGESLIQNLDMDFDLFLIDIGLPGMSGLTILKRIREVNDKVPVIIITEQGHPDNEIESFLNGASLFHKKPINYDLLLVQIKKLIQAYENEHVLVLGDLHIDLKKRVVRKGPKVLKLTFNEFNFLTLLIKDQCKVFTREEIQEKILSDKCIDLGAVDTLISRLRKKLGKYRGRDVIETIHRVGFRLSLHYWGKEY